MKCRVITHSEGVGLLPWDRRPPRRRPHLLRQWLRYGHKDEADVEQRDGRGQDHHQGVAVSHRQVRSDGRAGDQAGRKGSWYLEENGREESYRSIHLWSYQIKLFVSLRGGEFSQSTAYQTVRCAPLMLLSDICHVRKYHREGDGKNTGHGDDCKVPPERRQRRTKLAQA